MKARFAIRAAAAYASAAMSLACAAGSAGGMELWYRSEAKDWVEALPVGNGRLGAMAFGGVVRDRLLLNEDTIWAGAPIEGAEEITPEMIKECRRLLFEGKNHEAVKVLPQRFTQTASYQLFGDLEIRHTLPDGKTKEYRRSLSLDDAVARTTFRRGDARFTREAFSSFTDDVVIYRVSADRKGEVSFEASVKSPLNPECSVEEGQLVVRGVTGDSPRMKGGVLKFEGRIVVIADGGRASVADGRIVVVEEAEENTYFHDKRLMISIFMSPLNVHANWFPIDGKVKFVKHFNGNYHKAWLPKASEENEHADIMITTPEGGDILVRQIAGAVARRIVTYAKEGEECYIDEHMGFIKLGSRVDVFLPLTAKACVTMDQPTVGDQTIIAKLA